MANLKLTFESPLYFIGIGGSGMGPLAELCLQLGHKVSGSDLRESETTQSLGKKGANIHIGHTINPDLEQAKSVFYSSAVQAENPEYAYAKQANSKLAHRSDLLADFINQTNSVTIAGTHGKTTTACMIKFLLHQLGANTVSVIGSRLNHFKSEPLSSINEDCIFVAEADESDGSFLKYHPKVGVITNVESDHLDYYKNIDGIFDAFQQHHHHINQRGTAVIGTNTELSAKLASISSGKQITYGSQNHCDYSASEVLVDRGQTTFKLQHPKNTRFSKLNSIGKHNVENALAALAVVNQFGFDLDQACSLLAIFPGVQRRSSVLFNNDNLILIDDYAHNPGKIRACINSVRESWKEYNIIVIFQPHRYTRLKSMYQDFTSSFNQANTVICTGVYAVNEDHDASLTPVKISDDIKENSKVNSFPAESFQEVNHLLEKTILQNTVILTLGAGDITNFAHSYKNKLAYEKEKKI